MDAEARSIHGLGNVSRVEARLKKASGDETLAVADGILAAPVR
jgi:hypothetical protein